MALTKVSGSILKDPLNLGEVSIGGTLTYQDVTNVDSVGVITARTDISLGDSIIHIADTNTKIRFPAADTITAETSGNERVRIDSNGILKLGTSLTANHVNNVPSDIKFFLNSGRGNYGGLAASAVIFDNQTAAVDAGGTLTLAGFTGSGAIAKASIRGGNEGSSSTNNGYFSVFTRPTSGSLAERFRIASNGSVTIGKTSNQGKGLEIYANADAALRIQNSTTGTGANDGLLLEAGASQALVWNYESTPLKFGIAGTERLQIDTAGRLLLGLNSSQLIGSNSHGLSQICVTQNQPALTLARFENAAAGPSLILGKSRASSVGSYTVVQNDDVLGNIAFAGADGTDLVTTGANIEARVDGTPGSNDMPTRLVFATTSDGASSPTERFTIDSSGVSGNIKNNYALVAFVTDRDDGSRTTGSTSYQDDTGLNLTNAINYRHGDIFFVRALVPTGIALVASNTTNYQGVFVRIKITPSSGTTRYSADTKGWYRNDGPATKETMQLATCYYHLTASNTSQFNDNVDLSFQVQYHRDAGGVGGYGGIGLSVWAGERTLEVWQFRKAL